MSHNHVPTGWGLGILGRESWGVSVCGLELFIGFGVMANSKFCAPLPVLYKEQVKLRICIVSQTFPKNVEMGMH